MCGEEGKCPDNGVHLHSPVHDSAGIRSVNSLVPVAGSIAFIVIGSVASIWILAEVVPTGGAASKPARCADQ